MAAKSVKNRKNAASRKSGRIVKTGSNRILTTTGFLNAKIPEHVFLRLIAQ
jgi:hypothetical protein